MNIYIYTYVNISPLYPLVVKNSWLWKPWPDDEHDDLPLAQRPRDDQPRMQTTAHGPLTCSTVVGHGDDSRILMDFDGF